MTSHIQIGCIQKYELHLNDTQYHAGDWRERSHHGRTIAITCKSTVSEETFTFTHKIKIVSYGLARNTVQIRDQNTPWYRCQTKLLRHANKNCQNVLIASSPSSQRSFFRLSRDTSDKQKETETNILLKHRNPK